MPVLELVLEPMLLVLDLQPEPEPEPEPELLPVLEQLLEPHL